MPYAKELLMLQSTVIHDVRLRVCTLAYKVVVNEQFKPELLTCLRKWTSCRCILYVSIHINWNKSLQGTHSCRISIIYIYSQWKCINSVVLAFNGIPDSCHVKSIWINYEHHAYDLKFRRLWAGQLSIWSIYILTNQAMFYPFATLCRLQFITEKVLPEG